MTSRSHLSLTLMAILVTASPAAAQTSLTTTTWNGSTYELLSPARWLDAEGWAVTQRGAHLVSIQSAAENDFLTAWVPTVAPAGVTRSFWIGYTDRSAEGNWAWSDGSAVTYTNWRSGEPNDNGGAEDAAEISWVSGYEGGWNDYVETVGLVSVVEYAATPGTVTPEPATMLLLATGLAGIVAARRRRVDASGAGERDD